MKKIAIFASAVAGLFLFSCTKGDYGIKPAAPIHNDAPEAVVISENVIVTPVKSIILAEVAEAAVAVAPYTAELPEGQSVNYVKLFLTASGINRDAHEFSLAEDGKIAKADLQKMVTDDYGKDLVARPYTVSISVSVIVDGVANIKNTPLEGVLNITPTSETWGLVGGITGFSWDDDAELRQIHTGVWASEVLDITGAFKIRYGRAWDLNRGGTFVEAGVPFSVTNNGTDITVTPGKYQVIFREASNQVIINPVTEWSVIGEFAGTNWDWDLFLNKDNYSEFFAVEKGVTTQVKLRKAADWDESLGGTFTSYDSAVTEGSDNIVLTNADENMVVRFMYNGARIIPCTPEWAIIGTVDGSNWDWDYPMYETSPGNWVGIYKIDGEFKIRAHCAWTTSVGGTFAALDTPIATGDGNIVVPEAGKYMVVYNTAASTITVSKAE